MTHEVRVVVARERFNFDTRQNEVVAWSARCSCGALAMNDLCLSEQEAREQAEQHAEDMLGPLFRGRTHPPNIATISLELDRFISQLLLFKDTRVGATLREFLRRLEVQHQYEGRAGRRVVPQGDMMRFYATTDGDYPQHDSNHFTRFYDVVIKRHQRDDSTRPTFGFVMPRWDWEWIGPSLDFIVRHTPTEAARRAKVRRPLEHAFQLSEARMLKNPDDVFETALCSLLREEVLRRSAV